MIFGVITITFLLEKYYSSSKKWLQNDDWLIIAWFVYH